MIRVLLELFLEIYDIEQLERVQHRATRMIPGFAKLSYEERLKRIDLPTLVYSYRRIEEMLGL